MRKIVIGDIHGCFYTLTNILYKIKLNKREDKIIFLGDYIDRGKNSYETLLFLYQLQKDMGNNKCILLMGNHEHMFLYEKELWRLNGANKTKKSFYKNKIPIHIFNDWIKNFPLYYEDEEIICSHAGFPKENIYDCTEEELLWSRNYFYKDIKRNKIVFFGHTPDEDVYKIRCGDICLDTGCVFGNKLTIAIIETGKIKFDSQTKDIRD